MHICVTPPHWVKSAYVVTVLTIFVSQEMPLTQALADLTSLPEVVDSHHLSSEIDVAHTSHSHLPPPQWWHCHCYHCQCWRCYHYGWYYHWRCCPWCRRLRQLVGLTDDWPWVHLVSWNGHFTVKPWNNEILMKNIRWLGCEGEVSFLSSKYDMYPKLVMPYVISCYNNFFSWQHMTTSLSYLKYYSIVAELRKSIRNS